MYLIGARTALYIHIHVYVAFRINLIAWMDHYLCGTYNFQVGKLHVYPTFFI